MGNIIKIIKFKRGESNLNYLISSLVNIINRYPNIKVEIIDEGKPKIEKELESLKK